jgi:hypothetical protein
MIKSKRGYLQISFGWLFAIIVGIIIIALAIYFVTKMIDNRSIVQSAKTSKELESLLNPLETSFESAVTGSIIFPEDTRIYNRCDNRSNFGTQKIEIVQKRYNKWRETDTESISQNKYIFSEKYTEGKVFYIFSKPFEFPFKIANLIYITSASNNYCFIDAPEDIEDEISDLNKNIPNLRLRGECSENDVKVCFGRGDCEVLVDYDAKKVRKENEIMYFETDALMYAAIFSDKATYECQLKRLMQRVQILSKIYTDKESLTSIKCDSDLSANLLALSSSASYLDDIKDKNTGECKLW